MGEILIILGVGFAILVGGLLVLNAWAESEVEHKTELMKIGEYECSPEELKAATKRWATVAAICAALLIIIGLCTGSDG